MPIDMLHAMEGLRLTLRPGTVPERVGKLVSGKTPQLPLGWVDFALAQTV
ncbi:hypothetical protein QM637_11850 [Pantoea allii]|nr:MULTISPECIES: hypothetical protein [Pantoea]MDJ0036523.1 hypothetical protein [Pantoea allii]MDJ0038600.1 hypothetical protein [Pantoea allii]NQS87852.1 hypothetical protein [Pantoea allii]